MSTPLEGNTTSLQNILYKVQQLSLTGVQGTVFVPNISNQGIISWSNNGNLPNPESYNLKSNSENYIAGILAQKTQLKPEFANSIEELEQSGNTNLLYVLPDGFIYAYLLKSVQAYTNLAEPLPNNTTDTTKWVNGYRYGSGGMGPEHADTPSTISNSISCKAGDVIRIKGAVLRENNDRIELSYNRADTGGLVTSVGYFQVGIGDIVTYNGLENGVYSFKIAEKFTGKNISLRFAMQTPTDPYSVIITVNEEITENSTVEKYVWANTRHAFVPADYENLIDQNTQNIQQNTENIAENTENISNLNERVSQIESGAVDVLPQYWINYLPDKISSIKTKQDAGGKNSFSFVVIADVHYPSNLGKRSPAIAKKIMKECGIKKTLVLGDVRTRGVYQTKDECVNEWNNLSVMFGPIENEKLQTQGNHDAGYGSGDYSGDGTISNYAYEFTPAEMFNLVYRKAGIEANAVYDASGTAFYVDDVSNNVRYVLLNTHLNFNGLIGYSSYETYNGMARYPSMWFFRYTQSQYDFLIEKVFNTIPDNDWSVIIASHVPIGQSWEMPESEVMVGVLNAYQNKTTYSGSFAGTSNNNYDRVSVNCDFSNAKGELIAYFAGHMHADNVYTTAYPSGSLSFPIITTRCDGKNENTQELLDQRVAGTITEQSFDVFTVNKNERKIYATKIGAGEDRVISY